MRYKPSLKKNLVGLIGIDYDLIKRSGGDNFDKFLLAGGLLVLVVLSSFWSVFFAFDLMFHKWYAEFLLASFFSLTFLNIYLLLLQTFSKQTLPAGYKTGFWTTSNLARIGYMLMISFLLAQPIRIYFFRDQLDEAIRRYRSELLGDFDREIGALYDPEAIQLKNEAEQIARLAEGPVKAAALWANEGAQSALLHKIQTEHDEAWGKIQTSDFFLQRIKLVNSYRGSWLLCLGIILFYGLPVVLIYTISGNSRYYILKRNHEHQMVADEYAHFKKNYRQLFLKKYGMAIEFAEPFEDAPFNWIRKTRPPAGDAEDFHQDFFDHGF